MPRTLNVKTTPAILQQLPHTLVPVAIWDLIVYPGDAWLMDRMQRFGIFPDILAPGTIDRVKAEALAVDWTTRPGAQIVYTVSTGEALTRAIRSFGPETIARE